MTQPLVLAIEPDLRQAAIVKRIVREKALADIAVVETRDAAIEAMRTSMPDVLLLSALLSPRDEDELMAHLRTLDNAGHLQTHTIPQLASSLEVPGGRGSRGLLSAFRRKKEPEPIASGCDPDMFAEEIRVFIQRAAAKRREMGEMAENGQVAPDMRAEARPHARAGSTAIAAEPAGAEPSSWSSPFEWKPTSPRSTQPEEETVAVKPDVAVTAETETADEALVAAPPEAAPIEPAHVEVQAAEVVLVTAPEPVVETAPIVELPMAVEPIAVAEALPERSPVPFIELVAALDDDTELPQIEVIDALSVETEALAAPVAQAPVAPMGAETEIALESLTQSHEEPASEWAAPPPARAGRTSERLGPLAGWARTEPIRKAKPDAVTADDVRALIAALAVPPAVASVTYARGCRIRRVRVPAGPEHDTDSFGPVILSRRLLAEQRERRPTA